MSYRAAFFALGILGTYTNSTACGGGGSEPIPSVKPAAHVSGGEEATENVPVTELGGRLFDNWYAELGMPFVPDDPTTAALDGKGGPFGNGTLPRADGSPMPNPGHSYRLKNLFGWDLRGGDGIYGASHLGKSHVLLPDLLGNSESHATWMKRLADGEDAIPAYGKVLTQAQLVALVTFLVAVREGSLPQPADIFMLTTKEQQHYRLVPGATAARGHDVFARTCARCHGSDGAKFPIDGGHSVGSLLRQNAYETWLKVLNGHPGSAMRGQLEASLSRQQKANLLRDLHAAVCDRKRYPKANVADVADSDPRCGSYLR